MYNKKVDPAGLSLSTNRVAIPEVESPEETYTKLPSGLFLGLRLPFDNWGLKAVLCRNTSGATIEKWLCTEAAPVSVENSDLAAAYGRGDRTLSIATTQSATELPEDSLAGGFLWILGGEGLSPYDGFRKLLIKGNEAGDGTGPIDLELMFPLPFDLDTTTDVVGYSDAYGNAKESSTTVANKPLGQTLVEVEDDEYYWSVYEGDVPATVAATPVAGDILEKDATGGYKRVAQTYRHPLATYLYEGTNFHLITLHIPGIYQQYGAA